MEDGSVWLNWVEMEDERWEQKTEEKREDGRGKREAKTGGGGMDLPSLLPNAVLGG